MTDGGPETRLFPWERLASSAHRQPIRKTCRCAQPPTRSRGHTVSRPRGLRGRQNLRVGINTKPDSGVDREGVGGRET